MYFILKVIRCIVLVAFLLGTVMPPVQAQGLMVPPANQMLGLTPSFEPCVLRGLKLDPHRPFHLQFIVDGGAAVLGVDEFKDESRALIKFFLASLTTPEKEIWVNLSPYESNRIIADGFGRTTMGRDLLAQDYILKQMTSSLLHPDTDLGKKFWAKVYQQAFEKYGVTDIPVDTFNKVWIVPERAELFEGNAGGDGLTVFVDEARLKVMLESDYTAQARHSEPQSGEESQGFLDRVHAVSQNNTGGPSRPGGAQDDIKQIVRQIIIPALEKEVNEGRSFARLRQAYYSLLLAVWLKKKLKGAQVWQVGMEKKPDILSLIFVNQNKTGGIETAAPKEEISGIYDLYVQAFQKGIYNLVREEYDQHVHELIPHKYFSGGVVLGAEVERVMNIHKNEQPSRDVRNTKMLDVDLVQAGATGIKSGFSGLFKKVLTLGIGVALGVMIFAMPVQAKATQDAPLSPAEAAVAVMAVQPNAAYELSGIVKAYNAEIKEYSAHVKVKHIKAHVKVKHIKPHVKKASLKKRHLSFREEMKIQRNLSKKIQALDVKLKKSDARGNVKQVQKLSVTKKSFEQKLEKRQHALDKKIQRNLAKKIQALDVKLKKAEMKGNVKQIERLSVEKKSFEEKLEKRQYAAHSYSHVVSPTDDLNLSKALSPGVQKEEVEAFGAVRGGASTSLAVVAGAPPPPPPEKEVSLEIQKSLGVVGQMHSRKSLGKGWKAKAVLNAPSIGTKDRVIAWEDQQKTLRLFEAAGQALVHAQKSSQKLTGADVQKRLGISATKFFNIVYDEYDKSKEKFIGAGLSEEHVKKFVLLTAGVEASFRGSVKSIGEEGIPYNGFGQIDEATFNTIRNSQKDLNRYNFASLKNPEVSLRFIVAGLARMLDNVNQMDQTIMSAYGEKFDSMDVQTRKLGLARIMWHSGNLSVRKVEKVFQYFVAQDYKKSKKKARSSLLNQKTTMFLTMLNRMSNDGTETAKSLTRLPDVTYPNGSVSTVILVSYVNDRGEVRDVVHIDNGQVVDPLGGIDLNTAGMDIFMRAKGVDFNVALTPDQVDMLRRGVSGFIPIIMDIQSLDDYRVFLGLNGPALPPPGFSSYH